MTTWSQAPAQSRADVIRMVLDDRTQIDAAIEDLLALRHPFTAQDVAGMAYAPRYLIGSRLKRFVDRGVIRRVGWDEGCRHEHATPVYGGAS